MIWLFFIGFVVAVILALVWEYGRKNPWPEVKSYYSIEDEARHYEGVEW